MADPLWTVCKLDATVLTLNWIDLLTSKELSFCTLQQQLMIF